MKSVMETYRGLRASKVISKALIIEVKVALMFHQHRPPHRVGTGEVGAHKPKRQGL
jgi:hypothetical protein